jgi:hypothetical protein
VGNLGSDRDQPGRGPAARIWRKHVITFFLVLAAIVTGALAYSSQQAWWDAYMREIYIKLSH